MIQSGLQKTGFVYLLELFVGRAGGRSVLWFGVCEASLND